MIDEDQRSRIHRLKVIYRDFFARFSILLSKKDRILGAYEARLDEEERERLRRKLDTPSV